MWRILEVLAKHKLSFCSKKYKFDNQQIKYLELVISKNQVEMGPIKMARVWDWPVPYTYTDLQAFLDFTNFY